MIAPAAPQARERRERWTAILAALVTVSLWASAFVVIRYADRGLAPGALALGRLVVGSVLLGVLVLLRRESRPPAQAVGAIALCGVLWFGVYNVVLNEAERRVDAGTAAMLVNVGPILIAIFAGLILREGFPPRLLRVRGLVCRRRAVAGATARPRARRDDRLDDLPRRGAYGDRICGLGIRLACTSAGRMGSTTYLVPPLAVLFGCVLLSEVPPLLAIPGGALCLVGVALARSRSRSGSLSRETALLPTAR